MKAHAAAGEDARLPVAAIIVNWNGGEDVRACVDSLRRQRQPPAEIIVVDNGSTDGSTAWVATAHDVRLLETGANLGFAGGCNAGAAATTAPLLLFLNPDAAFEDRSLEPLARALDDPRTGVVGPRLVNEDGTTQSLGLVVDRTLHPMGARAGDDAFFVSGCALMIRRSLFDELNGFDESYWMFVEDLDLCWRAQMSGHDVRVVEDAPVVHRGGGTHPGGYIRDGGVSTDIRRMYLRERNTLAAVLTNYSRGRAVGIALVRVVLGLGEAGVFLARGDVNAARAYVAAFEWNVRNRRPIRRKRSAVQQRRVRQDTELRGVIDGLNKLRLVRTVGLPEVDGRVPIDD